MDINAFAQNILFSPNLGAKLYQPPELSDGPSSPPIAVPAAPSRDAALRFSPRGERARRRFPTLSDLDREEQRALVLHFFANHELLAMELMALALLRFPEAPAKFRRGLVGTILEEQQHLRLYQQRMAELGMTFGEAPVNRFFWDIIAPTPSPLVFVTQMGLTLEQANLDFSLHYQQLMHKLGDAPTAALLETVYHDEIKHVRHGLAWFNQWRGDTGESDWLAYQRLLPAPLTPARAKGIGYHEAGRRAAGLSEEFIRELTVYQHSKGRPPQLLWFNPGCEDEVAGRAGYVVPRAVANVTHDLAGLMGFLAGEDDVVHVAERPSTAFLTRLRSAGLTVPQFITSCEEVRGRLMHTFVPWGQSPAASRFYDSAGLTWQKPYATTAKNEHFTKTWAKKVALAHWPEQVDGAVCTSVEAAVEAVAALLPRSTVVMKAPLGSAGRRLVRVLPANGLIDNQRRWIAHSIAAQGAVIVEPWLDKVADFSVQIEVGAGETKVLGLTRFNTDGRGQYCGHVLGRKLLGLAPELIRAYHEQGMPAQLERVARTVGDLLAADGYRGSAGIDALVHARGGQFHLYPLVELNLRHTMGRIALALDKRVHAAAAAHWLHLAVKQIRNLGYPDALAFAEAMTARFPPTLHMGLIVQGAIATNDPAQAQSMLTMLLVGNAAEAGFIRQLPP